MRSTLSDQTIGDIVCFPEEMAQSLLPAGGSELVSLGDSAYEGHTIEDLSQAMVLLLAFRSVLVDS